MSPFMNRARFVLLLLLSVFTACGPSSTYTPDQIATLVAPGYDTQAANGCPAQVRPRASHIGMTIPPNALTDGALTVDEDYNYAIDSTIIASSGGWAVVSLGGANTMDVHAPAAGGGNMTIDSLNNVVFEAAIGAYVNSNAGERHCGTEISAAGVRLVPVGTEFALAVRQLDKKVLELQLAVYDGIVEVRDKTGAVLPLLKGEALLVQDGVMIARFPAPPKSDALKKLEAGQDLFGNPLDSTTPAPPATITDRLGDLLTKESPSGVVVLSDDVVNLNERTVMTYLASHTRRSTDHVPVGTAGDIAGQLEGFTKDKFDLFLLVNLDPARQTVVLQAARDVKLPAHIYNVNVASGKIDLVYGGP
jgi:hypothetical protein